jgi:hypothetical protein
LIICTSISFTATQNTLDLQYNETQHREVW